MKNHIVIKFIALLLCALMLLGAVGSAAGIIALTSAHLYDRTVDQLREEHIQSSGQYFATMAARYYCSETLGGMPADALEAISHWGGGNDQRFQNRFCPEHAGYAIKDAEGNIVESGGTLSAETAASVYCFPASGKYTHLVSLTSESEREALEEAKRAAQIMAYSDGETEYYNAISEEGASIYWALFLDEGNNVLFEATFSGPLEAKGMAFYNRSGYVVFRGGSVEYDMDQECTVYAAILEDESGEILYNTSSPEGVGVLRRDDNGGVTFIASLKDEPIPEETEPEETVPEETVPQTAATEVTVPQETALTEPQTALDENGNIIESLPEATVVSGPEPEDGEWDDAAEETVPSSASALPEQDVSGEPEPQDAPDEGAEPDVPEDGEAPEATAASEAAVQTEPTVPEQTQPEETKPEETEPEETEPLLIDGKPLKEYEISKETYYDPEHEGRMEVEFVYVPMPEMTVELYLEQGALEDEVVYTVLGIVRAFRNDLFLILGISVVLFAALAVYLCCAAGRKPKSEQIRAGGLNRLPLDLYFGLAALGITGIVVASVTGGYYLLRQNLQAGCTAIGIGAYGACLLFVGFGFAFAAQVKTPGGYWWRNSLCGRVVRLCAQAVHWLVEYLKTKGFPFLGSAAGKVWKFAAALVYRMWRGLSRACAWLGGKLNRLVMRLPLIWQWLLAGFGLFVLLLIGVNTYSEGLRVLCMLAALAGIVYLAHCFGILLESTKRMSKGDLDTKVDDKLLVGCFQEFAGDLNDLADVAVVAAKKQLKSERMKTELITNVSHDIKTPLTSIINYVDLLQKPHTDEEQQMYLEVLDRQSQRLKKLIEDLMEMSKANTGNMAVDIRVVDAVESVNQALGEFADKLDKAQLIPVFRHVEESVTMMADGRLVWRVLSNLLSNAVKYAMPGTRLYIDLMTLEGKVVVSLKNISRDELNVDADELMERFVRGDGSRNTEGSGLGLNIAKSLMELQKGQLQILVDGDLFKVTLIFPGT